MGKDIGLDAVLQLIGEKQDKTVKIMKCRNFSTHSDSWKKFRIRETEDRIFFEGQQLALLPTHKDNLSSSFESNEEEFQETDETSSLDDTSRKILDCVKENPEQSQKEIGDTLLEANVASRSTIYNKLKSLKENGFIFLGKTEEATMPEEPATPLSEDIDE